MRQKVWHNFRRAYGETERWTPVASAVMALGAVACCLPLRFVGAAGLVSLAAMLAAAQTWLLAGAGVLLAIAAVQALRGQRSCRTRGRRFSLPPGVRWEGRSPRPAMVGGAIIEVAPQIEAAIR